MSLMICLIISHAGAGDLRLSGPLSGQVKMLLEENMALQVVFFSPQQLANIGPAVTLVASPPVQVAGATNMLQT